MPGIDWAHDMARPTQVAVSRMVLQRCVAHGVLDVWKLHIVRTRHESGRTLALLFVLRILGFLTHAETSRPRGRNAVRSLILPQLGLSSASSFPGAPRINDGGCWMASQVLTAITLEPYALFKF